MAREKRERRPRSSGGLNWFGHIGMLDDESLYYAATLAAAALAAPGEREDAPADDDVIEVTVPKCKEGGDTVEVRVPTEAGGGTVRVSIPHGLHHGQTFEFSLRSVR